jgi:hypothetical protein
MSQAHHFLLHILSRDPRHFSRFVKSLQETPGQEFIADYLLQDCVDASLRTPAPTVILTDEDQMNELQRSTNKFFYVYQKICNNNTTRREITLALISENKT